MENKKKLRFINLFDIIVLALAAGLLAILLLVGRNTGATEPVATNTYTCRYTIELRNMVNNTAELIEVGDTLVDKVKKYDMGKVVSVEVVPTTNQVQNVEDGTIITAEVPGLQNAVIVVEAVASETDTQITVDGGYLVRVGLGISVRGPGYWGTGNIIAVERSEG